MIVHECSDRQVTSELSGRRGNYVFNLDFHEEVRDPSVGYAVDAFNCGEFGK